MTDRNKLAGDEPMKALQLLDLVPGYYRDHYPKEMQAFKEEKEKCNENTLEFINTCTYMSTHYTLYGVL